MLYYIVLHYIMNTHVYYMFVYIYIYIFVYIIYIYILYIYIYICPLGTLPVVLPVFPVMPQCQESDSAS